MRNIRKKGGKKAVGPLAPRRRERLVSGTRTAPRAGSGSAKKKVKKIPLANVKVVTKCPYCSGTKFVKAGFRIKKHEKVQVFFCKHCGKKFTPLISKGRTYPIIVILKSLIMRNRFYSPEAIAAQMYKEYGFKISPDTIKNWIKEHRNFTPFTRLWDYLAAKIRRGDLKPKDIVVEQKLFHQQIYDFKYHRGKTEVIMEDDFRNYKLRKIKDFLELIVAECPHQVFKESDARSSEFKKIFNLDGVKIVRKENRASEMAKLVMQSVANNKERHERLQEFMFFCDSSTLAVEVPVLLDEEDIAHYKGMLNFNVPLEVEKDKVITGHIDIVQLRNGAIHIMDFKPSASRSKPIEQLTIYALALSRLTSLRLFNFKCAWFDEEDYFEFYPLHVVYKKKRGRK